MDKTKVTAPANWQTTVQHPRYPLLETRYWNMPDPAAAKPSAGSADQRGPLIDPRISNNHKSPV